MKISRETADVLRKALVYFVMIFLVTVFQTSFLAVIEPFGAVPDLVLLFSVGAGYFCGSLVGGIFGVAAGAMAYTMGGLGATLMPLFYCAVGAFVGFLVEKFLAGKFTAWMLYVVAAAAVKGGFSLASIIFMSGDVQFFAAVWRTVILEFVGTLVLGAIAYIPIKKLSKFLK